MNPGRTAENPATNRLSYGTALNRYRDIIFSVISKIRDKYIQIFNVSSHGALKG
jgi:hypothetical protein